MIICTHPERRFCIGCINKSYFKDIKEVEKIIKTEKVIIKVKTNFVEHFINDDCPDINVCKVESTGPRFEFKRWI